MRKTNVSFDNLDNSVTVPLDGLIKMLNCGRDTAIKIGNESGAKIQIGRRVLYNVEKVKQYLNQLSEE